MLAHARLGHQQVVRGFAKAARIDGLGEDI
jgi:hypothetical protein